MSKPPIDIAKVSADYQAFRAGFRTLILGTQGNDQPLVSYAPFVEQDGSLYIYVSELATHTHQLMENGGCGVLLIEDEQDCRNLFARRRISYQCRATEVARDSDQGEQLLGRMEQAFGNIMELLRTLGDFHLIRLDIVEGSYVAGFGKAFRVRADGSLEHVSRL